MRFGISDTALWVLYAVCSSAEPPAQYDLANAWHFPKQTVNSAITGLERAGIIRLAAVPGTRNRKSVLLTETGRAFCAQTVIPLLEAEKRAFLRLSRDEWERFMLIMEKQIDCLAEEMEGIAAQ